MTNALGSRFIAALVAGTVLLGTACGPAGPADRTGAGTDSTPTPTRVVVMIADGAGLSHWTMAYMADPSIGVSDMQIGLVDTQGADHVVSGSAPTATAYATGVRTFMGAVGVGPDSLPVENATEAAAARGLATGLITTTSIVDATPASFALHSPTRYAFPELSRQLVDRELTVVLGGGRMSFDGRAQGDDGALMDRIRSGYTYVETIEELTAVDPPSTDRLFGLLAQGDMGIVPDRGETALTTMVEKALGVLDRDPDGFFLMIENEESDTQSHANADMDTLVGEMLDFTAAVQLVLDYQATHPETLVLVTSDHETGGVSLDYDDNRDVVMGYSSGSHTGIMVPLFARGPGAEAFGGILRNDDVGRALLRVLRGER